MVCILYSLSFAGFLLHQSLLANSDEHSVPHADETELDDTNLNGPSG